MEAFYRRFIVMLTKRLQLTYAAPSAPRLRLYRWASPADPTWGFLGLTLGGRELRLWSFV